MDEIQNKKGRNEKGQFAKGHPDYVKPSGVKPGSKRTMLREVKDAMKVAEDAMPDIIAAMIRRAKGEVECPVAVQQAAAEYLCDRIYGKPNQPLSGALNLNVWADLAKSAGPPSETRRIPWRAEKPPWPPLDNPPATSSLPL